MFRVNAFFEPFLNKKHVTCDTFITDTYWYYIVRIKNTNDTNRKEEEQDS